MDNTAGISDTGLYLSGLSKPYDPRAAADAQESMKAKLIAIRKIFPEQVSALLSPKSAPFQNFYGGRLWEMGGCATRGSPCAFQRNLSNFAVRYSPPTLLTFYLFYQTGSLSAGAADRHGKNCQIPAKTWRQVDQILPPELRQAWILQTQAGGSEV